MAKSKNPATNKIFPSRDGRASFDAVRSQMMRGERNQPERVNGNCPLIGAARSKRVMATAEAALRWNVSGRQNFFHTELKPARRVLRAE